MSKSILQPNHGRKNKKCYITGRADDAHKHHIFPGNNRTISDKYGFWVWLWSDLHNGNNPEAVHNNPNQGLDLYLKRKCQMAYEENHSRDKFMSLIHKNYLED